MQKSYCHIDCETCILYMPDVADICMQVMVLFNYRCVIFAVITFFFFLHAQIWF